MSVLALLIVTGPALAAGETPVVPPATSEPAVPADKAVAAIVSRVQDHYESVESLQARFVQVTRSQVWGDEEQRGTLSLQRPNRMRWSFEGDGQQFVSNGETMWVYSPTDRQVIRYKGVTASSSGADALLWSLNRVGELFEVEVLPAPAGHRLRLVARDEAARAQVKRLVLQLGDDLMLERVEITDPFDSVTELSFRDVRLGASIAAGTFEFDVPADVELIDANDAG